MPVVSASAVPQKAYSAFGITTRRGLSSVSSTMCHPSQFPGIDGPGAEPRTVAPSLRHARLGDGRSPAPVRRGLFGADVRQIMACRRVAGAVIGAACSSDPAVDAAHRRRHWALSLGQVIETRCRRSAILRLRRALSLKSKRQRCTRQDPWSTLLQGTFAKGWCRHDSEAASDPT